MQDLIGIPTTLLKKQIPTKEIQVLLKQFKHCTPRGSRRMVIK
jgi:hypothetical protein